MELIIALILFVAIVASWFVLPATSDKAASHSSAALPAGQAQRTA